MLQIITGKFYRPGERYETLHRAVFFTNYRIFQRETRLETPVGVLMPTTGLEGMAALTCEIVEKIEKHPDGDQPGVMISTGGDALLNDFAAVTAFALNITCTPDLNLARLLMATERPTLGSHYLPHRFINRTFDKEIIAKAEEWVELTKFVTQLVGLERKRFEGAMRAIQQYISGLHRISDNISLAYALLVSSIESLAQEFDGHVAEWPDYEHRKRESTGNGGLFLDFEMERGADGAMTGYAFPEMLADIVKLQKDGKRNAAHDLFDAHLPLLRYEHQQGVGLAVRKYVLMKRGFIASDAQRKPGAALSEIARKEVDFLLGRLATHDIRARVS